MIGRKRPLALLIMTLFMVIFVLGAFGIRYASSRTALQDLSYQRAQQAATSANYLYLTLKQGNEAQAIEHLKRDLKRGEIDFYILKRNHIDISYGSPHGDRPKLANEGLSTDEMLIFEDMAYANLEAGEYQATVGVALAPFDLFWREAWTELKFWHFASLALGLFAIGLAARFFLKDIRDLLEQIGRRTPRRHFSHAKTRSHEADVLARGLAGYQTQTHDLAHANRTLGAQILSGPRHELESGRRPPYSFSCTLVRTDVNDFSTLFASPDKGQAFLNDVNAFFEDLTAIVGRYGGYVYEFVGDEAIYYFKDEDSSSSAIAALSAVRDIHAAAEKRSQRTLQSQGYDFFVKSSAAHGELLFGKQVRNFSLAGTPLIETVRIIGHIVEKKENKVYYGIEVATRAAAAFDSSPVAVVTLKGLPGERQLFQAVAGRGLEHALARNDWALAGFYRANEHVALTLNHLRALIGRAPNEQLLAALAPFRSFSLDVGSPEVKRAYLELLQALLARDARVAARDSKDAAPLASVILAARALIPRAEYDESLKRAFAACLGAKDLRVVANALEAFAWFEPESDEILFENSDPSRENNRVRANLLVKDAFASGFDKAITKRFASMLKSPNALYVASALWALGEVAAHYRALDPVYFNSETRLQNLIERAAALTSHENEMVARQARQALAKAGSATAQAKPAA